MEMDPLEMVNVEAEELQLRQEKRLNTYVSITVALLATFLGICSVKSGNIGQGMQQAQANTVNTWAWYQARNLREEIARATVAQLELEAANQPVALRPTYQKQIATYQALAESQNQKKEKLKAEAEGYQATYDQLNFHDNQFDLSEALLAVAIALLAMTTLAQKRWLFFLALVPSGLGVFMGLAGLMNWKINVDSVASLLAQTTPTQHLSWQPAQPRLHSSALNAHLRTYPNQ